MTTNPLRRNTAATLLIVSAALLAGCGNAYRSTIGTNNPVPVPNQPEYLPVVLSSAGTFSQGTVTLFDSPGEATILDLSGDTVVDIVNVGIAPIALAEGTNGAIGYSIDLGATVSPFQGQVSSFGIAPNIRTPQVSTTSLNAAGSTIFAPVAPTQPTPCSAATPPPAVFANGSLIYVTQTATPTPGQYYILPLSANISGTGVPALEQPFQVSGMVTNFTGLTGGTTTYAIERDSGTVDAIGISPTSTPPTPYFLAKFGGFTSPTFGVTSVNGHRVFILNCDGTVTPINTQSNTLMTSNIISILPAPGQATAGAPIWGDYYNGGNLLVTANTTGPSTPGSVSVINASENAQNFGVVLGTAPVGNNPSGVAVLQDGTRAYVSNEGDDLKTPTVNGAKVDCNCKSVSIVSLTSDTTVKTVPLYYADSVQKVACPANGLQPSTTYLYGTSALSPTGYPMQIATAPDTVDEKVYVLCDQPSADGVFYVFAIRTFAQFASNGQSSEADIVSAVIPIEDIPTQLRMTPAR